jgi:hypothetical protein
MNQRKPPRKRKHSRISTFKSIKDSSILSQQQLEQLNIHNSSTDENQRHEIQQWKKIKVDYDILSHVDGGFFSLEELDGQYYRGNPSVFLTGIHGKQRVDPIELANLDGKAPDTVGNTHSRQNIHKTKSSLKQKIRTKRSSSSGNSEQKQTNGNKKTTAFQIADEEAAFLAIKMSAWLEPYPNLHLSLVKALCDLGFERPTPIQAQTLGPALRDRKNILGAAETGSGKTLAFGLPILQQIIELKDKQKIRGHDPKSEKRNPLLALILSPTRELAKQIVEHLNAVAKYTDINVVNSSDISKARVRLNKCDILNVCRSFQLLEESPPTNKNVCCLKDPILLSPLRDGCGNSFSKTILS